MNITLTPELAAMINKAVTTGGYASTSEVVREALRDWRVKRLVRQQQVQRSNACGMKASRAAQDAARTWMN